MRLLGLLVLCVAACGGSDSTPPDANLPDAAPPAPDAAPPDAAPPDAAPPDAELLDAGPVKNEGIVILGEIDVFGSPQGVADATLNLGPLLGGPDATTAGCGRYDAPMDLGLSAGTIAIGGANIAIALNPNGTAPDVAYEATPTPPADFVTDGATLTATAVGGPDIPAFMGSVVVPDSIVGFTPPSSVSRSMPPTLTWTATSADEMWAWIQTTDAMMSELSLLWCRMPDTGSYTFPTAATMMIPPTHTIAIVILFRTNVTNVVAGSESIAITAIHGLGHDTPVALTP